MKSSLSSAVFAACYAGNAPAADAAKGKKVYNSARLSCIKAGKNKVGPALHGLWRNRSQLQVESDECL